MNAPRPPPSAGAERGPLHRERLLLAVVALAIAAVTAIPFLSGLHGGFVFDDEPNLVENAAYRGLGPSHLRWMFTTLYMGHYQPLTWLTLAIDARIWGAETPFGFLLTNLLLHCASAAAVFFLALRLIGRAKGATGPSGASRAPPPRALLAAAAGAALLFSLHPLRVESVSWATERRDLLSGLLLLLSLLAWLRAVERSEATGAPPHRLASVVLFSLALLSKEIGVTLPVVLLLLDFHPLRRRAAGVRWRTLVAEKWPWLALSVVDGCAALLAQVHVASFDSLADLGVLGRLATCAYGLGFYVAKLAWPVHLSAIYELALPVDVTRLRYVASAAGVLVAGGLLAWRARRDAAPLVAAAAYAVLLAPLLGLIQCGPHEVADRYSYLPSIPLALLAGGALHRAFATASLRVRFASATAGVGVLALLAVATARQTRVWKSSRALWSHAAANEPASSFAHYNYGCALAKAGKRAAAAAEYRRAIECNAFQPDSHLNLGNVLREEWRCEEALREYELSVRVCPGFVRGWLAIAGLDAERGDRRGAIAACRTALALEPDSLEAGHRLARLLFDDDRLDESIAEFDRLTHRHPESAVDHYDYGVALAAARRWRAAIREYETALRLAPDLAVARSNLEYARGHSGGRN
jgi:tetratricopeptide (TPR) repeat protein